MKGCVIIMFKIAIVGTGSIGLVHINAIAKLPECELVALCDLNEERVRDLAEKNNVPYFLNYKDIPSKVECDAVIINLPHGLHCESAIFFLDHGIHVLMEKPMANTVEECDRMIEAEKRSGKKLAIAHIQRFTRANQEIKKIIDSGELGRFCMFTEERSEDYFLPNRPAWFHSKKMAGGGVTMNYGAHAFDKLFYIMGDAELTDIHANCANYKNDHDIEGHVQIFTKFNNGISASISFSGYNFGSNEAMYYFTDGLLKLEHSNFLSIKRQGDKEWTEIPDLYDGENFVREINEFRKYAIGEKADIPTSEYGRKVISAIEKVFENLQ